MSDKTPAMHSEFPRWYRTVDIEENHDRLHRRWTGVASLGMAAKCGDLETMIRLVFRSKHGPSADSIARVRKFFRDADDFFDAQDNGRELEVLCGSTLSFLMQRDNGLAGGSALAVTTSALGGARPLDLPMDLPSLAEQAIRVMAESQRNRPDLTSNNLAGSVKLSFENASTKIRQQSDWDGVAAAFGLAADATRSSLQQIVNHSSEALNRANSFITVQDEELQILWWLFGERSTDFGCAFKDLPVKALPLVLAKELADATQFLPGPPSAKAILSRAGLNESTKLTVSEAVRTCDPTWLTELSKRSGASPVSEPIHLAIQRRIETGNEAGWIAGWTSATGIDEDLEFSALTLGNLFYRERLLALFSEE